MGFVLHLPQCSVDYLGRSSAQTRTIRSSIIAELHGLDNSEFPINYTVDSEVTLMKATKGVRYNRQRVNLLSIGNIKDIGEGVLY